jgi:deoxyribodipyrimidine photolyase
MTIPNPPQLSHPVPLFRSKFSTTKARETAVWAQLSVHRSLGALRRDLSALGAPLIVRRGRSITVLDRWAEEASATSIHDHRQFEPSWQVAEAEVAQRFPLVLHEGNRVRMIATSFLVKHLLIDWRRGERWFWNTLLDADLGTNAMNWRYVAGSGVDAPVFSRMMAPLVPCPKFAMGDILCRFVLELAYLRDREVHAPHEKGSTLSAYPLPIIPHEHGRALAAWDACSSP